MKIKLWSDIHLEFNDFDVDGSVEDKLETTLVLAGDIGTLRKEVFLSFLNQCADDFKYVIYVIGNHECYGQTEEYVLSALNKFTDKFDNFHILHNQSIVLDGIRFIGTPLYSNTEFHPLDFGNIKYGIADYIYTKIEDKDTGQLRLLNPHDTFLAHEKAVSFIENELALNPSMKTVVVTHWPPTHQLTEERYVGNELQNYFCNHDEYLMQHYNIDLWLFGHTHQCVDVEDERFFGTRIVSNARGYGDYEGRDFNKEKVIEI